MKQQGGFSHQARAQALTKLGTETFDFLVVGGGITGAAVARDAASRGLKVALIEKRDFAWGTSSRSSKLIHGGLRYLENFEFKLVFEALAERALLLKIDPHLVRPLPFYMPVYKGDLHGKTKLNLGLWLYDLLALFRAPEFHKSLSKKKLLQAIPFLKNQGLVGGLRYYDASMWDDALAIETLRSAHELGASIANYTEAVEPLWEQGRVAGFKARDLEKSGAQAELEIRAHSTVICAGPWTDVIGEKLSSEWKTWLSPSKGVHLIFDLKRIPLPGAMVMSHPSDGRISFVIPRPDMGNGIVIVGTTDSPSPLDAPEKAGIEPSDVNYLMELLSRYFPELGLTTADILSAYVGVRPLMGGEKQASLQKVSREHYIGEGPGGVVLVAGGKYTTHRKMAEEIVDFTLPAWKSEISKIAETETRPELRPSRTHEPVNPAALPEAVRAARNEAQSRNWFVHEKLFDRYGAEALGIFEIHQELQGSGALADAPADPEGFPLLAAQLVFSLQNAMAERLEDFYFRRTALFSSRADHGLPWAEHLSRVWARERGFGELARQAELESLRREIDSRMAWRARI